MNAASRVSIATVTPVYAGSEYLRELVAEIGAVRDEWIASGHPCSLDEAIFVNDGAQDRSLEVLRELERERDWMRVLDLAGNFGQHQATTAGVRHASADWVATIDEDLQHHPRFLTALLEHAIRSRADLVYAHPRDHVHQAASRDWTSKLFKAMVSAVTGNRHVREFNSYRLIRGSIARAAAGSCTHGTYLDIALCWFTDRIASLDLPLEDVRTKSGKASGYSFRKLLSHARRLVISSDVKLLRAGALLGLLAVLVSLGVGSKLLFQKLLDPTSIVIQGWTSLIVTMLFFGGLVTVFLGIIMEYLSVLVLHIQGKPTFFVVDRRSDKLLSDWFDENPPAAGRAGGPA